jgi:hypothetical protein
MCGFGQFVDDFSDGDFTLNPIWSGDAANFEVDGNQRLHLNAPAESDTSFLSVSCEAIDDATWEFLVELDFNPSSSNLARIYLVSNNANLDAGLNGYYVRLGGETEDRISLYRQDGESSEQLIASVDDLLDADPSGARIRVTRTAGSDWELLADTAGGTSFVSYGTANDTTYEQSLYVGVWCKYSPTRSDKFYFDDFNVTGNPFIDSEAPTVEAVVAISDTEVDVLFSEVVDQTTAETLTNYAAGGSLGNPSFVQRDGTDQSLVHLTFATQFTNGTTYNLTVSNVEDLASNPVSTTTVPFTYVIPSPAGFRDVVINEFMCDPTPFVGLADAEFVELFNTSSNFIDITGWKLGDASSFGTIGSHIIGPGEYALLVSTTTSNLFAFYSNVVEVTSFPSLNNSGDSIILQNSSEEIIDELGYDLAWYQDESKEDGGYSIEQINPFASCVNAANWSGSEDVLGGTPSSVNSVFDDTPDTDGPNLLGVVIVDAENIEVVLDESLDGSGLGSSNVILDPELTVNSVTVSGSSLMVSLDNPIDTGVTYTLILNGISDCEMNPQTEDSTASFILPFTADSGQFVINEVLFNPYTGGSDYVELVNITDRPLNLKGWMLANYDYEDGISNFKTITTENYSVDAGGYVLVTEDTTDVRVNYINHGIDNFIQADIPSYNNDSGTVYLLNVDTILSEAFSYSEDLHFSLLTDVDGVSLERLDFNRAVDDEGNWHSAAQTSGFGTPGLENSQFFPTQQAIGEVSVDPELFSPRDGNGNNLLNINFKFDSPGFVATVRIYDSNGRPVKTLATNELLSNEGTFTWDGTTDSGELARIGMYIILFEAFSSNGGKSVHKLTAALGGRL